MLVFAYLMYKTPVFSGVFKVRVDPSKLIETMTHAANLPINEYGEACREFSRCINKLDKNVPVSRLFEDSIMSHEIMAYYLLSASDSIKVLLKQDEISSAHVTYEFDATTISDFKIKETIYPGPEMFAPDDVVSSWLKNAF